MEGEVAERTGGDAPKMRPSFTERTHKAGGFLLVLAGVIGAIVGLGLLIAATGGAGAFGLSSTMLGVAGSVILVLAVIECVGGWSAYKGKNWYGSMAAGVLGLATFFTLPLDFIGTLLTALGESQFDERESSPGE